MSTSPITLERLMDVVCHPSPLESEQTHGKKRKDKKKESNLVKKRLKDGLGSFYENALMEHVLAKVIFPETLPEILQKEDPFLLDLYSCFQRADEIVFDCQKNPQKGWIYAKKHDNLEPDLEPEGMDSELNKSSFVEYLDFHPFELDESNSLSKIEFDSFNKAVDTFFSSIESQKLELKSRQAQANADKKLESVKAGHAAQVAGLSTLQEKSEANARAIEQNLDKIEALLRTLRGFLASGMDWVELNDLIKNEARRGNDLASMVEKLKLQNGLVTIKLPDPTVESMEQEEASDSDDSGSSQGSDKRVKNKNVKTPMLLIDIDLYSSAYANARKYFESRKVAAVKQEKTIVAVEKALKAAEKKIQSELKSVTETSSTGIVKMRKPFWFEKFLWFISSENFLVVGGKDAQQNELLVKRYMKKEDVYVHADLHGASSVIIKNNSSDPIPPTTLSQAGTMSVVQSKAWDSKIITSAWWVYPSQVSKTAPSGEYLTTGSFMIRGKKNWLPPIQLVYGFGLFFKVDESCIGNHYYERRPWARNEPMDSITQDLQSSLIEKIQDSQDSSALDLIEAEESKKNESSSVQSSMDSEEEDVFPETVIPEAPQTIPQVMDKYQLDSLDYASDSESLPGEEGSLSAKNASSKKHVSARERRLMKKKGQTQEETFSPNSQPRMEKTERSGNEKSQQEPTPRGKKGKLKKIKEKYKDQDEEDRELIAQLLGSSLGPQPKGKKAKAEAERKAKLQESKAKRESTESFSKKKVDVEAQKMLEEENITLMDEDQEADTTFLDTLTGEPLSTDILLNAVPVCAPWTALSRFKYKVKLIPGSLKKGKAAKAVMSCFTTTATSLESKRELELIKSVTDSEVILQILGKVKVVGSQISEKKKK